MRHCAAQYKAALKIFTRSKTAVLDNFLEIPSVKECCNFYNTLIMMGLDVLRHNPFSSIRVI